MDNLQNIRSQIEYLRKRASSTVALRDLEPEIDTLLSRSEASAYKEGTAELLLFKSEVLLDRADIAGAEKYMLQGRQLAGKIGHEQSLVRCMFVESTIRARRGDIKGSYVTALDALPNARRIGDNFLSAYLQLTLGSLSLIHSADDDALSYFFSGLHTARTNGYKKMEAQFLF